MSAKRAPAGRTSWDGHWHLLGRPTCRHSRQFQLRLQEPRLPVRSGRSTWRSIYSVRCCLLRRRCHYPDKWRCTMISRRGLLMSVAGLTVIAAAWSSWTWYYRSFVWPREIQTSILGSPIVDGRSLLGREGYSHYGEGMFRWRYRIYDGNSELARHCPDQRLTDCEFTKSRRVSAGVVQSITYSDGVLTVEEVWS